MEYKKAIKTLRIKMCLTQEDLGKMLGVSFVTVCRWESGKYEPTMKLKYKLKPYFSEYKIEVN